MQNNDNFSLMLLLSFLAFLASAACLILRNVYTCSIAFFLVSLCMSIFWYAGHVDHIFSIKAFMDVGISDLKVINNLDNLQPVSAEFNLCKNAKYDRAEFETYLESKGILIKENHE